MTYFPPFRFDVDQGALWRGPERVRLTPKAASLLKCLVSGRGAWISKPAIMAAVWPDTHVQPDNIKVLVHEIRQALGDSSHGPTFIRTSPGQGYAFVAEVSDAHQAAPVRRPSAAAPVFVGRDRETAALEAALEAARTGTPRLVLLSAEQGMGKTALCDAFLRTARSRGPLRSCYGQCFERASLVEPYYPILDALLRLDRQHRGVVPSALARHAPSWLAHFPQWLGTRVSPLRAASALDELAAALAALSREAPLVLVVEELQWADVATLQALTHLAASPLESNLLVVATFGDGEWIAGRRARQRVLSATARTSTIRLPPLTAGQTLAYVDATFGPSTLPDVAAALYQATAGHPFLMRTACESLISRGFLVGGHEGWRRAASLDAIAGALPETLAGAVAQQLEHLAPREREALEAAAAVGRSFMASQVAYVLETSLEETRALLAPLARRGQLIVLSHELRSSSAQYRFRHAIYSDAIARRAPMIRQRRFSERIRSLRDRDRHRA